MDDDDDVEPIWHDSVVIVYDETELPRRTNLELSKIMSSPLVNCDTKNVEMTDVVGVRNRRISNMEVRGINDGRVK